MRYLLFLDLAVLVAASVYLLLGCTAVPETASASSVSTSEPATSAPVLLELYTSEACSSCPPADRLLTKLAESRPNVIALEFHVDYWDGDSWKDRFSSPLYTQRQQIYSNRFALAATYTPQMIVNGVKQFVGSDAKKADEAIESATKAPLAPISTIVEAGTLKVEAKVLPGNEQSTVYLAVTENGLSNKVSGGENEGATLAHTSVVRLLKPIGVVEKKQEHYENTIDLPVDPEWKKENLSYIVFVQENASRKIIAVTRVRS